MGNEEGIYEAQLSMPAFMGAPLLESDWISISIIGSSIEDFYCNSLNVVTHSDWQKENSLFPLTSIELAKQTINLVNSISVNLVLQVMGLPDIQLIKASYNCSAEEALNIRNKFILDNTSVKIRKKEKIT